MARLAFTRSGAGPPLVLLHALGLSRRSWDPVVPELARHHDVVAVDLPGFGDSAALPPDVEPTPAALAGAVAELLDELGLDRPHVVGNSLGGWIALELAALRPVASLTLLSPAGLWHRGTPRYDRVSLAASRWLSVHAPRLLHRLVGSRVGRVVVLGQAHGRPGRMSPEQARVTVRDLGRSPGFDAAFAATLPRHYRGGAPLDAPVTAAFGSRDLVLLPWQSRHLDELPAGTRRVELPGCGHIPMSDDPPLVAAVVLASVRQSPKAPVGLPGGSKPGEQ